jgi:hypothetical protein
MRLGFMSMVFLILLSACAAKPLMPSEIILNEARHLDDSTKGTSKEKATACAYDLVKMSSANEAVNITYDIIGVDNPLIVDVHAILPRFQGFLDRPVTLRCIYRTGMSPERRWTRGLGG